MMDDDDRWWCEKSDLGCVKAGVLCLDQQSEALVCVCCEGSDEAILFTKRAQSKRRTPQIDLLDRDSFFSS